MLGFSNFWVISALTVTALPVIKVIFYHNFKAFKHKQTSPSQNLSSPDQNSKSQTLSVINQQTDSSELNALKNQFLKLLYGDQGACKRLIQFERRQNPHKSEIELYQNAIARLLRDRGHY